MWGAQGFSPGGLCFFGGNFGMDCVGWHIKNGRTRQKIVYATWIVPECVLWKWRSREKKKFERKIRLRELLALE